MGSGSGVLSITTVGWKGHSSLPHIVLPDSLSYRMRYHISRRTQQPHDILMDAAKRHRVDTEKLQKAVAQRIRRETREKKN
jgi:hypothetical protein